MTPASACTNTASTTRGPQPPRRMTGKPARRDAVNWQAIAALARAGAVCERAYGVVREAELSHTAPDPRLVQQVEVIAAAMTSLGAAIRALPDSHAAPLADEALEQLTLAEHAYREAIADLESETDLRRELRRREQYRRCELLAEAIQHLARRTWYAVYKSQ